MPTIAETITARIIADCRPVDREARFDAMLDDCYSFESIGGPFAYMQPSAVLREMDPTAYRCGVNDMEDAEEWVEIEGEYYERADVEQAIEDAKTDLECEISDLERELEAETEADDSDPERVTELERQIKAKQEELQAVDAFLE
jgi:hypothetical protein